MLTVVPAIAAIGVAGWVYQTSQDRDRPLEQPQHVKQQFKGNSEQREAMHAGFLRPANRAANIIDSDETRVIRTPQATPDPMINAAQWQAYHFAKNNQLGKMYSYGQALDNRKILRYDYAHKPRLLQLPNAEGYGEAFGNVPNAFFDRFSAAAPLDERLDLFRDPFGDSGGAPIQGRSNVVLNKLYVGNAWGAGGQQFVAVGNQQRDPGYADKKPSGILRNPDRDANVPAMQRSNKRVQFEDSYAVSAY